MTDTELLTYIFITDLPEGVRTRNLILGVQTERNLLDWAAENQVEPLYLPDEHDKARATATVMRGDVCVTAVWVNRP